MRRPVLWPLVPVYGAGLWVARRLAGEARRLVHPVVSVGSLSAGGAGKTPVVQALGALLGRAGFTVAVLSRGYGREAGGVERVEAAGTARRFGDEPLLLAREGAQVYVGADRYAAGVLAEREAAAGERLVHLLDDGFQHRALARALDVVLLTRADAADCLLPAGNLREPLGRLRAAGAIVVREDEAAALRSTIEKYAPEVPVWVIRRELGLLPSAGSSLPRRPVAFCGIARPEGFFAMLRAAGIFPVEEVAFKDHHRYWERDVTRLLDVARRSGADGFVTTEKDAVKLSAAMQRRLAGAGPLLVPQLTVSFLDEAGVLKGLLAAIRSRGA